MGVREESRTVQESIVGVLSRREAQVVRSTASVQAMAGQRRTGVGVMESWVVRWEVQQEVQNGWLQVREKVGEVSRQMVHREEAVSGTSSLTRGIYWQGSLCWLEARLPSLLSFSLSERKVRDG